MSGLRHPIPTVHGLLTIEVQTGDIIGRPGNGRREKAIVCSDDPKEPFIVFVELSVGNGAWRGTVATPGVITYDRFDPDKGHTYQIHSGGWQVDDAMYEEG